MNPLIASEPTSVEGYVLKKKTKDKANELMESFKEQQSYVRSLTLIMDDNEWKLPDNLKALTRMLKEAIPQLESNIQLSDTKEEEEVKKFSINVLEECPKLLKNIASIREELDNNMISNPDAEEGKVLKFLTMQESDFIKLKQKAEKLQEYQVWRYISNDNHLI